MLPFEPGSGRPVINGVFCVVKLLCVTMDHHHNFIDIEQLFRRYINV